VKIQAMLLAVLATTACNSPQTAPEQPPQEQFIQKVRGLREPARNLAFRNAIRDSNLRCERVARSAYQEKVKGTAMWVARCTDTGDYAIFVNNSGYAQVARCEDLTGGIVPRCTAFG